jgi:hypothetical protein
MPGIGFLNITVIKTIGLSDTEITVDNTDITVDSTIITVDET